MYKAKEAKVIILKLNAEGLSGATALKKAILLGSIEIISLYMDYTEKREVNDWNESLNFIQEKKNLTINQLINLKGKYKDHKINILEKELFLANSRNKIQRMKYAYKGGYLGKGFGYAKSRSYVCFRCGKNRHIATYCPELINKNNRRYFSIKLGNKRCKIEKKFMDLEELKKLFNMEANNENKKKYCNIKKCLIKTAEGKITKQKPYTIPQAYKKRLSIT